MAEMEKKMEEIKILKLELEKEKAVLETLYQKRDNISKKMLRRLFR